MPLPDINNLLPALGWTLIHSLWQGLVLTVLAGGVVLMTKKSTAALRYALLCMLHFLFLGGVAVSFWIEWSAPVGQQGFISDRDGSGGSFLVTSYTWKWINLSCDFINAHIQVIVLVWGILFFIKSGKMVVDLFYLQRLRRFTRVGQDKEWTHHVQRLACELGIRKNVALFESLLVRVPLVIGHFKPLILVPAGMLTYMPPAELEAVLLHELAHIRRHDYAINMIQRLSELVLFFNPGFMWVSSLVRVERENCCDDIALSRTGKVTFVEALVRCKEQALSTPGYAMGLLGKKSVLLQRMTRIVYGSNNTLSPFDAVFFVVSLLIMILLLPGMQERPGLVGKPVTSLTYTHPTSFPTSSAVPLFAMIGAPEGEQKKLRRNGVSAKSSKTEHESAGHRAAIRKKMVLNTSAPFTEAPDDPLPSRFSSGGNNLQPEEIKGTAEQGGAEAYRTLADAARQQADLDREQARKDREQAARDRVQADYDRAQALKDRAQAEKDREQAQKDRDQALQERTLFRHQQ